MVSHLVEVAEPVTAAVIIALAGWIVHLTRQRHNHEVERDRKLDRLLQLFEGEPADPLANRPATPGVLGRIASLDARMTALEAAVHAYHPTRTQHEL
jgi:hypothetical protein